MPRRRRITGSVSRRVAEFLFMIQVEEVQEKGA
jgi:hypothetical protein